jgi:CO/xanthine dehydrogenase FAD-binding subunit
LTAIQIEHPSRNTGSCYIRFTPRNEMDIAVVGVGASLVLNEDHSRIESARLALGAVAPTPLLVGAASEMLAGSAPSEDTWNEAAILAQSASRPITDVRGSTNQRKHLVGVLTKRALRNAYSRAQGDMED